MSKSTSGERDFPSITATGLLPGQLQCFWNSQNHIPVLDQSVAGQVGRDASNIMTPSSISLMMTLLDYSNSDCISSFHANVVPGFKSARNGSILSAAENAYATWLTSPHHDRMSVMFAGVGKSRIDSRNVLGGRTLFGVISKPANSTLSCANTNLLGFNVIPLFPHNCSHSTAWWNAAVIESDHMIVSSIHFALFGTSDAISSNLRV